MRTLGFVVILIAMTSFAFAFPTYHGPSGGGGGYYNGTTIPLSYGDETGKQFFDGDYGKTEWFSRESVSGYDDYYARYEQQHGYAYPWVGWIPGPAEIIFDMGTPFTFNQVGVHSCWEHPSGIAPPTFLSVEFSNDGTNFFGLTERDYAESWYWPYFETFWLTVNTQPTTARYAKVRIHNAFNSGFYRWCMVDEMSINGMDGAQFASSVPEPSSLLTLASFVAPLVLLRRRKG